MSSKNLTPKKHQAPSQKLLEQMLDGVLVLEYPTGIIQNANDAMVFFCGMTRSTLIGKNFWDLGMLTNPAHSLELYEQIIQKRTISIQDVELSPTHKRKVSADICGQLHSFQSHEPLILLSFENKAYIKLFEEKLHRIPLNSNTTMNGKFQFLLSAANSIDIQNAEHQLNVSRLATAMAKELGLDTNTIDRIMMSALVHDIGKISVPKEILNKSTALTLDEAILIKNHVKAGYDILKRLLFPLEIAKIILQHHERLDGSGYPHGLIKSEICQEARILMVADTIESMLHSRPYRPEFALEISLHQIEVDQYSKLASDVVNVCTELFREKKFAFDHGLH